MLYRIGGLLTGLLLTAHPAFARSSEFTRTPTPRPTATPAAQDDSVVIHPAKDLALQYQGERKAQALASYVEALDLQEDGESEKALAAFEKVLNVDPGEVDLATRVAFLLTAQGDYPRAIDILKDAVKAQPNDSEPYLQLAYIYAKYLKKTEPAIRYARQAIALAPTEIDGYQRLCEVQLTSGDRKAALLTLDQAARVQTNDPSFWTRLGKLYLALIAQPKTAPKPEEIAKVNQVFRKALALAPGDAAVLKDAADYFAASQQVKEAIPLYLRVLELQPNDSSSREKLATGFLLTNQRDKAIQMLQEIIQQHPEQGQTYQLLGKVLEDEAEALAQAKRTAEAKTEFSKAAASYEQSLLIDSNQPANYLHLAELFLTRLREDDRAVKLLQDARRHFPGSPEVTYLLAVALREAKQTQPAVTTFEEALREAEAQGGEIANARFYFEYGATAERAGLYEKAAELFKKSIQLDPANAAEAYNYLGFMWADQSTKLEEAESYIKKALEADPDNGAYLDSLGWLDYKRGHYDEALAQLLNAAKVLKADDPTVFDHIADTYEKLNELPRALDYWQRAFALDQTDARIADKIKQAKAKLGENAPPDSPPTK